MQDSWMIRKVDVPQVAARYSAITRRRIMDARDRRASFPSNFDQEIIMKRNVIAVGISAIVLVFNAAAFAGTDVQVPSGHATSIMDQAPSNVFPTQGPADK